MPDVASTSGTGPAAVEWIRGSSVTRCEVPADRALVIGRDPAADLCLDPEDLGISRRAASVHHEGGRWWLANLSSSRPITVREPSGLPGVLAVGASRVIDRDELTFVITGLVRRHALRVSGVRSPGVRAGVADEGDHTVVPPVPTDVERAALVAVLEGYLRDFPRWEPVPRTYGEAAERLGLPASTVRKRIESYRLRMKSVGLIVDAVSDAREELAVLVLGSGVVTPTDLTLLDP